MVKAPQGWRRVATSLCIVAALVAAVLVVPGSVRGWAAAPTTLVYGKSGDADSLDSPVSSNGEAYQVTTQIFTTARPGTRRRRKPTGTAGRTRRTRTTR